MLFLHDVLHENVYMQVLLRVQTTCLNQVYKLVKTLYELKQPSRQWLGKHFTVLIDCGYIQSASDHSLFFNIIRDHSTTLLVYIDDLILARYSMKEFNFIKGKLDSYIKKRDFEVSDYFLGLKVVHFSSTISIC